MKTKSLLLAFAGLGLFACTNEDLNVGGNGIDGSIVSVNIITDTSVSRVGNGDFEKPSTGGTSGTTKPVDVKTLMLKLEAGQGGKEVYFPITTPADANRFGLTGEDYDAEDDEYFSKTAVEQANLYKFTGVRQPTKMILSINGGTERQMNLPSVVSVGLASPMYSSVNILASMYNDAEKTYKVPMKPEHRLALLEFSGISHLDEDGADKCWFSQIYFSGLFLNKIKVVENENPIDPNAITNWDAARMTYTCHEIADDEGHVGDDFKASGAKWPSESNNCYAYNIFPASGDQLPVLTLYFTKIKMAEGKGQWAGVTTTDGGIGYATVKTYKLTNASPELKSALEVGDDNIINSFKPGYVYRFTNLAVPDKAIGGGINGGEDVNVVAEVEVLPWTLVDGTVEWN